MGTPNHVYATLAIWHVIASVLCVCTSCNRPSAAPVLASGATSFHDKVGWNPSDFFNDSEVVELCLAIQRNDLDAIKDCIANGTNVNQLGKGNITPLLWAFPDAKRERFDLLLQNGADPNVRITSDLGVPGTFASGESVTSLAASSAYRWYFESVINGGGDPNILGRRDKPLIHVIIDANPEDVISRCRLALEKGADVNAISAGLTPVGKACRASNYELAEMFLDSGATPDVPMGNGKQRLIHILLMKERDNAELPPAVVSQYYRLLERIQKSGEDIEAARRDLEEWSVPPHLRNLPL